MSKMRWVPIGVCVAAVSVSLATTWAADDDRSTGDRVLDGVLSGLLGGPASRDPAYLAEQRDRLISALQAGEYVTSRQGEPVDLMILGVPLTHRDHVYTARPIPPSQTTY
jgi:hypothetical protein